MIYKEKIIELWMEKTLSKFGVNIAVWHTNNRQMQQELASRILRKSKRANGR